MKKDEILRVRIDKGLKDKLLEAAKNRDVSYSHMIREWIKRLKK